MTLNLSPQMRIFTLVGGALIAAFALLMVVRSGVIGGSDYTSSTAPPSPVSVTPARPAKPSPTRPAVTPTVKLVPGLPPRVASALQSERVVVVSLYTKGSGTDRTAATEARDGAQQVGAGFLVTNLLNENQARAMRRLAGAVSAPSVLIVKRPGKIVARFAGFTDAAVVAQAAHNAGAR